MRLVILRDYEEQFWPEQRLGCKCHRDRAVRKPRSQQALFKEAGSERKGQDSG